MQLLLVCPLLRSWFMANFAASDYPGCIIHHASSLYHAGVVQQQVQDQELQMLVAALCSDTVRSLDQGPAQQQLLAVIFNTVILAGRSTCHPVIHQPLHWPVNTVCNLTSLGQHCIRADQHSVC